MATEFINTGADDEVGALAEAVVGEVETSAAYNQILVTGATFSYTDNEVVADDTGDRGGPTGRRRIAKVGGAELPMIVRHDTNKLLEEHAFRDDYTSELTVTGTTDIDIDPAATLLNGDAGIQITAPEFDFDALKNGVGDGALFYARDFANADNNQLYQIHAVHVVAGAPNRDAIDVRAVFGAGTAADPFGAPKIAEAGVSAVLRFGEYIKNYQKGNPGRRALSLLVDRFMHINQGRFRTLVGFVANDYNFEVADEGIVRATVTGDGRFWTPSAMVPQSTQPVDSHYLDNIPDRQLIVGGEDLEGLYVVGFQNTANPAPVPILLGDTAINSFSFSLAGNNNVITSILGMRGGVPRRGKIETTGSLSYYVGDDQTLLDLERLGDPTNHYKAGLLTVFRDPDGFRKALVLNRCEFGQSGGEGGGDGEETGTLEYGVEAISKTHRTVLNQQWSVFV